MMKKFWFYFLSYVKCNFFSVFPFALSGVKFCQENQEKWEVSDNTCDEGIDIIWFQYTFVLSVGLDSSKKIIVKEISNSWQVT